MAAAPGGRNAALKVLDMMAATVLSGGAVDLERSRCMFAEAVKSLRTLTLDDALALVSGIAASPFNEAQRQPLLELVNNMAHKKSAAASGPARCFSVTKFFCSSGARNEQQCNEHVHNYMSAHMWDRFFDTTVRWDDLAHDIVDFLDHIECLRADSKTFRALYATWLVCRSKDGRSYGDVVADPLECLSRVQEFGVYMKSQRRFMRSQPHHELVMNFPVKPEHLKRRHEALYERIFASQAPVECRVNSAAVRYLCSQLPCRGSHSSVMPRALEPAARASGRAERLLRAPAVCMRNWASIGLDGPQGDRPMQRPPLPLRPGDGHPHPQISRHERGEANTQPLWDEDFFGEPGRQGEKLGCLIFWSSVCAQTVFERIVLILFLSLLSGKESSGQRLHEVLRCGISQYR